MSGESVAVRLEREARMHRAATLLGQGLLQREVAAAVGISARQLREWMRSPDLQALARRVRTQSLDTSIDSVLRQALLATRRDGTPDHEVRLRAASMLLHTPEALRAPPPADEALQADEHELSAAGRLLADLRPTTP